MLQGKNQVKQVLGNTQCTLQADANESYRIKSIRVSGSASAKISVEVNRVTVASLRASGTQGSHIFFPNDNPGRKPLYEVLIEEGIFRPIPVAAGQKLTITGAHDSDSVVQIIYDKYDAGDVSDAEPNGTKATEYDFIQYASYNTTLVAGDNLLDTQQSSPQFPSFPLGKVVPANTTMTLHGIAFSGVAKDSSTGTNQQKTNYLRIVDERKVLFDDDLNGLLYDGGAYTADTTNVGDGNQTAGNRSSVDFGDVLMFDPPLVYSEGRDVDFYINTTILTGAANIGNLDAEVALIMSVRNGA